MNHKKIQEISRLLFESLQDCSTIEPLTESYPEITIDDAYEISKRFLSLREQNGEKIVDLFFKPLTRDDRVRAQSAANTDDALTISTYLLCKNAENEDGSKAFSPADAPNLQRELPENVLNEIELFMFDIKLDVDTAKK